MLPRVKSILCGFNFTIKMSQLILDTGMQKMTAHCATVIKDKDRKLLFFALNFLEEDGGNGLLLYANQHSSAGHCPGFRYLEFEVPFSKMRIMSISLDLRHFKCQLCRRHHLFCLGYKS